MKTSVNTAQIFHKENSGEKSSLSSPFSKEESLSSSDFTTLKNKLESKIGKQKSQKLDQEIELRSQIQGMSMMKAKFYERTKPFLYKCRKCPTAFESL